MKYIKGYEKLYSATIDGKIYSHKKHKHKGKFLKFHVNNNGYLSVGLSRDKKRKTFSVHRIIANTFLDNTENKEEVNHIDGDKKNNNIENLQWVTSSENQIHAIRNGLQRYTEKHRETARKIGKENGKKNKGKENKKLRKLTMKQAEDIRNKHCTGYSMMSLGKEYEVDKKTISAIIKRIRYVQ